MTEYHCVTTWRLEAPLHQVYEAVFESLRWPDWWPGAERVEQLAAGGEDGIGNIRRYTWKSRMRYRLCFDALLTRIEPLALLEATASGDLHGIGRWTFSHERSVTTVRHEWRVRTTKWWMVLAAPAARALFEKNHHALMQRGAEGLARRIKAPLLDASQEVLPSAVRSDQIGWKTGIIAGTGAGVIATLVQLLLWWINAEPLPEIFYRDARMAAAIILGQAVLPPPSTFDPMVMLAASVIHLALSIVYGLALAVPLSRLARRPALAAGAAFGLLLYGINMHGFTAVFPWFEASRDWITVAAHLAFGVSAAWIYTTWEERRR